MTVPIEIPVTTPGASSGKQQVDGLTASIEKLDTVAKRNTQTAGQATTAANTKADAFKRVAETVRATAAAEVKAAAEVTTATEKASGSIREQESHYNKLGAAVAKVSPGIGEAVKSMGSMFGAVGLAAVSVKQAVSVAMDAIAHDIETAAKAPGKLVMAIQEAKDMIGDARTARGASAASTLAQQSDSLRGLTAVGGDAAVLQAQEFAGTEGQDVGTVMASMVKMMSGGMTQQQTMSALKASSQGSMLGFGSFSELAGKAGGMKGDVFTGNGDKDLSSILSADSRAEWDKGKPEREASERAAYEAKKSDDQRAGEARFRKDDESWQRRANMFGQGGATRLRPDDPKYTRTMPFHPSEFTGGVTPEEIQARRERAGKSSVAGAVDAAALARARQGIDASNAGLQFGYAGTADATGKAKAELANPALDQYLRKSNQQMAVVEAARLEAEGMDGVMARGLSPSASLAARRKYTEEVQKLDDMGAAAQAAGIIPGGANSLGTPGNPLSVQLVNPPAPAAQSASPQ